MRHAGSVVNGGGVVKPVDGYSVVLLMDGEVCGGGAGVYANDSGVQFQAKTLCVF